MTISPAVFWGPVQLAASATLLGSACPPNTKQILKRVVFTNTDTTSRLITVYVSRNGAATATANIIIDQFPLAADQAYVASELANLVLGPGDGIYAMSDVANKVNTVASGFQQ